MPRLCPGGSAMHEVEITSENGRRLYRQNKGAFDVDNAADARTLRREFDCFTPGTSVVSTGRPGWVCECGWLAAINHCPRCDRSDLTREVI